MLDGQLSQRSTLPSLDSTNLVEDFLSLENFLHAFSNVAAKKGCSGIDEETIDDFQQNLRGNLSQLKSEVAANRYQPLPCKQVLIPKGDGQLRELRIPTVRDRIVQHALLNVLNPIAEQNFSDSSFAYRPSLSYLDAVNAVAKWRDLGYRSVLDADLTKFFDRISHQCLLKAVKTYVEHPGILGLIQGWVSVGVLAKEGIIRADKGIPQGSVISPLLANIYLDSFDKSFSNTDWKLVRYADDFVVLAQTFDEVITAYSHVNQTLNSLGLELHPQKSLITNFQEGFRFLGHGFLEDAIFPLESNSSKSSSSSSENKGRKKKAFKQRNRRNRRH